MSRPQEKRPTILHFGTDHVVLLMRAASLDQRGYHVLSSSNGFETVEMARLQPVDAVVLDLDRNVAEVALVAKMLKRCRPHLPTVVLTDGAAPAEGIDELADAHVPHRHNVELLVNVLESVIAGPHAR